MKHLCRRSESQSFTGAVIQSVFDHLNFLVRHVCHGSVVRHVLPQQDVEVLVGASLPTVKGPGKIARSAQRCINPSVHAEFLPLL